MHVCLHSGLGRQCADTATEDATSDDELDHSGVDDDDHGEAAVSEDGEWDESQLDAAYELEMNDPPGGDDEDEELPRVHWTGNTPFGEYTPHEVVSVSDARCRHEVRVEVACGREQCLDFLQDWQAVSACFDLVDTVRAAPRCQRKCQRRRSLDEHVRERVYMGVETVLHASDALPASGVCLQRGPASGVPTQRTCRSCATKSTPKRPWS